MSQIQAESLHHSFSDGSIGIMDINLTIDKGEFVLIAGRNGSGKTTFCRHLNGLLLPTQGNLSIDGLTPKKNLKQIRQKVGMVFQNADNQFVAETVISDVSFGPENLKLSRAEISQRVEDAISATGLTGKENDNPQTLSGGEKRKLAIAGVLAMKPEILVFDEPFSNLDYPASVQLLQQILQLHKQGHTIIMITHELEKVVAHADRLVIFQKGRIVDHGTPASIIDRVETYGIREPCSSRYGKGLVSWLN